MSLLLILGIPMLDSITASILFCKMFTATIAGIGLLRGYAPHDRSNKQTVLMILLGIPPLVAFYMHNEFVNFICISLIILIVGTMIGRSIGSHIKKLHGFGKFEYDKGPKVSRFIFIAYIIILFFFSQSLTKSEESLEILTQSMALSALFAGVLGYLILIVCKYGTKFRPWFATDIEVVVIAVATVESTALIAYWSEMDIWSFDTFNIFLVCLLGSIVGKWEISTLIRSEQAECIKI